MTARTKISPTIAFQASTSASVSDTRASIMLIRMAPMQAPSIEPLPPTAAQTTIETENPSSRNDGDANSDTST